MQGLEERDQGRCLGWTQILSVGWHVASALDHLPDQLVLREPQSDSVERRAALTAHVIKRMAVVALLGLENQCAPAFESGASCRYSAGIGTLLQASMTGLQGVCKPRCVKAAEHHRGQQNRQERQWAGASNSSHLRPR